MSESIIVLIIFHLRKLKFRLNESEGYTLGYTDLPSSIDSLAEEHIIFLGKCHTHPKASPIGGYISKTYFQNELSLIERFIELRLLSGATLAEKLEDMTVAELESLFHQQRLTSKRISKKQNLIDELLSQCDNSILSNQVRFLGRYHLTDLGHRIVQQYRDSKSKENAKITETCVNLICYGKIDEAYHCICKRNIRSLYPVGIGVNWAYELSHGYPKKDLLLLDELLKKKREIPSSFEGNIRRFNATSIYYILSGDKYSFGKAVNDIFRTDYFLFSNQRCLRSYASAGIKRYRFSVTLDLSSCPICAGLDGKVFRTSKAKIGVNFPPMHPNCRCTTMPDVDAATLAKIKRAARDPVTGKSITVPGDMSYADWYKQFVQGVPEALAQEVYMHSDEYKQRQLKWNAQSEQRRQKEASFYINAESRILSIVRDNPGILQKDLTTMFGDDLHNAAAFTLNRLSKTGYIKKVKNGRTYSLYIVTPHNNL